MIIAPYPTRSARNIRTGRTARTEFKLLNNQIMVTMK